MRTNSKFSRVICFVLVVAMAIVPMFTLTSFAADTEVVFQLGANGSASHYDGSEKSSYSETVGGYTLSITGGSKAYTGARDAKGNSCIKLGTGSAVGKFSFTVPDDVTSVIIQIAKYKANTTKININGTAYTLDKNSNEGAYNEIEVDTTSTKTVTLTTVSGGERAMVNSITYVTGPSCEHKNVTPDVKDATCTEDGYNIVTCDDCGKKITDEVIEATGHKYVDGFCNVCKEEEPNLVTATLTFDADKENRTEFSNVKQVWVQNGITFTNDKASSSTAVADYGAPVRLYASSTITVEAGLGISEIQFECNNETYATNLKNSIGAAATASGKIVTVEFATLIESYTVAMGAQVRLNSITVSYEAPPCTHVNKTLISSEDATCTKPGSETYKCDDCGDDITITVPTIPHKYDDGICVCGRYDGTNVPTGSADGDSSTIDFTTKDDRLQYDVDMQIWASGNGVALVNKKDQSTNSVGDYAPVRFYKGALVSISSAKEIAKIEFVCNETKYANALVESIKDGATVAADGKIVTVVPAATTTYTFSPSEAIWIDSLTVYFAAPAPEVPETPTEPTITEASVTIGTNLAMNYTVFIPGEFDINNVMMVFTMNDVATEVNSCEALGNGYYVFTFNRIAPQCMGDLIDAELYIGGEVVATLADYSVKAYAEDLLKIYADKTSDKYNEDVVNLVVDMLDYGAAAQVYQNYNTDALVNTNLNTGLEDSDVTPDENDDQLEVGNSSNSNYAAYSFGVRFDYVNKIFLRFNATSLDGVTVTANGNELEITPIGGGKYAAYSGAINALDFDEVVTFVIKVEGVTVQTVKFSVNTYIYLTIKDGYDISPLALALYNYGKSAEKYAENN